MSNDGFGIQRLARIEKSGVRKVFTPHKPVSVEKLFFGRETEVKKIMDGVTTPGQHVILFGDRGVGKSSLANFSSANVLKHLTGGAHVEKRCDSSTQFEDVAMTVLKALKVETASLTAGTESRSTASEAGGEAGVGFAKAGARRTETSSTSSSRSSAVTPSTVADLLRGKKGLIVIDEFDAIRSEADRTKVAELLKLLSDTGSGVKVLVVGVAASCQQLLAGHPSVQRCLKEVRLGRMSEVELRAILLGNAKKVRLSFHPTVVQDIVAMSAGYPHFTQLLGLKAAEEAVGEGRVVIERHHFLSALASAVKDAEESLRDVYTRSTMSNNTDMFVTVLRAAAGIDEPTFSAAELRARVSARCNRQITQNELNNHFTRLVANDDGRILKRVAKGRYRFTDPRMPSYVRMCERASEPSSGS